MGQILYERPREKLYLRGAGALSRIELIQVVIGSGGANHSSASIAKRVDLLFEHKDVGYASLLAIQGIGAAKACQLLAVQELAHRISQNSTPV